MDREAIVARDKKYLWHPYTPMAEYIESGDPIVVDRARGARLYDRDGREYLEGNSSWWASLLGHNHPRLVRALEEQLERFAHVALAGTTHEPAALLAEKLVAVTPERLTRVFYSDNGSTALEAAIKLSAQYWHQNGAPGKTRFLSLAEAFHGETLGVTALGGVDAFRRPFGGLVMSVTHLPSPAEDLDRALESLRGELERSSREIAALVVEPLVQGAGGMRLYSPEYLRRARELTEHYGVHLIVDEVFTGYGRTGPMWASSLAGIEPDVLCTAKGLSAGLLPFAATLASEEIFRGFDGGEERAFYYGHTYFGNPLGAAVALEVLRVYEEERILEGAEVRAAFLARAFDSLRGVPGVRNVRALGMIAAFDLEDEVDGYLSRAGWRVARAAKRRGALVRPLGNVVYLAPPLNVALEDLERLAAIVLESTREVLVEIEAEKKS